MTIGIYMIRNLKNGKRYIGSSRNIEHRWASHLHDMKSEFRLGNYLLRADYRKHGSDAFEWVVLEKFEDFLPLVEREQFWLDAIRPEYNIRKTAHNNKPSITEISILARKRAAEKMTGRKASPETRSKMSASQKKRYLNPANHKPLSEERKQHLSKINTGEGNPNWGTKRTDKFRKTVSDANSTTEYTFLSPHGEKVVLRNLLKNGEQHTGLKYWELRKLYQGKKQIIKGWTIIGFKKDR